MYLKRLYTEPAGLFETIEFTNGINFVFGKKSKLTDTRQSLNGIGKSLLLDFVDFCLMSSVTPRIKLAKEKELISGYAIVLEFEIDNTDYLIKRNIDNPNSDIEYFNSKISRKYNSSEIKEILCDLVFKDEKYLGSYSNQWFRKLMPFFVKIQPPKKEKFTDPLQYMHGPKAMELLQFHLRFMGIDNSLSYKNYQVQSELKAKQPLIKGIEQFIEDKYDFLSIDEATNEIDRIISEIRKLENLIEAFKLAKQYESTEEDVNKLTERIKDLWYENFSDKRKIDSYEKSFMLEADVNTAKVKRLYKEINDMFADKIKVALDEAIKFRKELSKSRKEFLDGEINNLKLSIDKRNIEIDKLEDTRSKLFSFLANKEAIKDLSEAYISLSKKREKLNEIEGKLGLYNDFQKEKAELKSEAAKLYSEILQFIDSVKKQISHFRQVFIEVYNSIYVDVPNKSVFTITPKETIDAKIDINISFPADLSKGKNQGRTLVYDLSMLFHSIKQNIKGPRFIIHDGIFDGMDKAHFVHLYEFIKAKSNREKMQYIVTLNEEGTLNELFGKAENVTPEKIADEAIKVLMPDKKLLNKTY